MIGIVFLNVYPMYIDDAGFINVSEKQATTCAGESVVKIVLCLGKCIVSSGGHINLLHGAGTEG